MVDRGRVPIRWRVTLRTVRTQTPIMDVRFEVASDTFVWYGLQIADACRIFVAIYTSDFQMFSLKREACRFMIEIRTVAIHAVMTADASGGEIGDVEAHTDFIDLQMAALAIFHVESAYALWMAGSTIDLVIGHFDTMRLQGEAYGFVRKIDEVEICERCRSSPVFRMAKPTGVRCDEGSMHAAGIRKFGFHFYVANQAAVLHSFFIPKRRVAGRTFADEICVAENTAFGKLAFHSIQLAGAEHGSIRKGERGQNGCRGNQSPDDADST